MCHLKMGAIDGRYNEHHHHTPARQNLVKGMIKLDKERYSRRLTLLETKYTAENKSTMNCQTKDRQVLPHHEEIIKHRQRVSAAN